MANKSAAHTFVKQGVFYFVRRVPLELRRHYTSPKISYSLRTRSLSVAASRASRAADKLDEYWFHLRVQDAELPGKHLLRLARTSAIAPAPTAGMAAHSGSLKLSEAVSVYLWLKGAGKGITFHRAAERSCGYVLDVCGDMVLTDYTKADANAFRDDLIKRGMAGSSLTRVFGTVRAVINFAAAEEGISRQGLGSVAQNAGRLHYLAGRTVGIRHSNHGVPTALDYQDTLPDDLAPMVILDASDRVRETYALWEKERGGLVRLCEARKDYSQLRINLWSAGGGKASFTRNGDDLLRGIVAAVNTKPNEEWLIIHHKDALDGALPDRVRGLVNASASNIHFIHWGKHHGVNDYGNVPNVILAGTQFLPPMTYEGRARLAANLPPDQELPTGMLKDVTLGEHADLVLQGLSRASVRKSVGGGCAPCTAYIIASRASGICELLPRIFPGCTVKPWQPIPRKLSGNVKVAVEYVERHFEETPDGELLLKELQDHLGIANRANFNRSIRKHTAFMEAMEDLGVAEVATGSSHHLNALIKPQSPFSSLEDTDMDEEEDDGDF